MALPPRAGALDAFAMHRMGQIEQRLSEQRQLLEQRTGRLIKLEKSALRATLKEVMKRAKLKDVLKRSGKEVMQRPFPYQDLWKMQASCLLLTP